MDQNWDKVEEIIDLTDKDASYYFSQAMKGSIRIRGKFIRDENGKRRPVLVKTSYQPVPPDDNRLSETSPWGVLPIQRSSAPVSSSPPLKKNKWFVSLVNWFSKSIKS